MPCSFKIETHMHTAETSKCGCIPAEKLVALYMALGYQGIVITDHLHAEYIDLLYCRDDWDTCVDRYLDGYRRAKAHGDRLGLDVALGCELRFTENDNDYLVYGIDEAFLRAHPYPFRMGPEAFWDRFNQEVLIIQAHPCRAGNTFVRTDCVHGIEIVNGHLEHENYNERALELCKRRPSLFRMAGSDTHRKGGAGQCWATFAKPIRDSFDYADAVRSGDYTLGSIQPAGQAVLREADAFFGPYNRHAVGQ